MTEKFKAPARGAFHRPPALGVLKVLGVGQKLKLEKEPTNEYDANAIKVLIDCTKIDPALYDDLDLHVSGFGYTKDEIIGNTDFHLAYVGKECTGKLHSHWDEIAPINSNQRECELSFDPKGNPEVQVTFSEPQTQIAAAE